MGQSVSFKSTSTYPDGPISKTEWDLNNDGTFGDAITKTAKKAFAAAGTSAPSSLMMANWFM